MTPEEKLRFLVLGAQREGNRIFAGRLAPYEVTPSQAEVLRCLADAGGLSLKALGRRLVCEAGSPSRLVSSLVDKGWVARREDPRDRRRVVLMLTAEGRRLEREVRVIEAQLHGWMANQLDCGTISQLIDGLKRLVAGTPAGEAIAERSRIAQE